MSVVNLYQIAKSANAKKIIEFNDFMETNNFKEPYGQLKTTIHSKRSKINITIVDSSNGGGSKAIVVKYNLNPEVIKTIASQIISGQKNLFLSSGFKEEKINTYKTIQDGFHPVTAINIKYQDKLNNPWTISIINGKGKAAKNKNGGTLIKKGSFQKISQSDVYLSDYEMLIKMITVRDYILSFEQINISKMLQKRNELLSNIRNQRNLSQNQAVSKPRTHKKENEFCSLGIPI